MKNTQIYMVSDLEEELVRKINFIPFRTVQEAIDEVLVQLGKESKTLLMPSVGLTLPILENQK